MPFLSLPAKGEWIEISNSSPGHSASTSLPANEIVVPVIIMAYMAEGSLLDISDLSVLRDLLVSGGWTWITAVSTMLFSLLHWPCFTNCLTIEKGTQSV